jgi:hypothetical protein
VQFVLSQPRRSSCLPLAGSVVRALQQSIDRTAIDRAAAMTGRIFLPFTPHGAVQAAGFYR